MSNKRKSPRSFLTFYLDVFNLDNGEALGQVYDITQEGFMLISDAPITTSDKFVMKMAMPEEIKEPRFITFEAEGLRSFEDVDFNKYRTGFKFKKIDKVHIDLIENLINDFGYRLE